MDIRNLAFEVFQELKIDTADLGLDTNLRRDLEIDSTEMMEIAFALERRLSVQIDIDEFLGSDTFRDVLDCVTVAAAVHPSSGS